MGKKKNMNGKLMLVGSIGAGIFLILSMVTTVVSAQTMNLNERQNNIFQQIKEKMKNNDWKPGDILDIKLLKDNIKDVTWFPGMYLFSMIFGLIILFAIFIGGVF